MTHYSNDQVHAALSHLVIKMYDYEDWLLRGVGNTVMLLEHMPQSANAPDDVKWRTVRNLHKGYIEQAYAAYLERRCLYEEMRNVLP